MPGHEVTLTLSRYSLPKHSPCKVNFFRRYGKNKNPKQKETGPREEVPMHHHRQTSLTSEGQVVEEEK